MKPKLMSRETLCHRPRRFKHVLVPAPDEAPEDPATVHGEGGDEVEEGEDYVDVAGVLDDRRDGDWQEASAEYVDGVEDDAEDDARERTRSRHPQLRPRVMRLLRYLGDASEEVEGDAVDWYLVPLRH